MSGRLPAATSIRTRVGQFRRDSQVISAQTVEQVKSMLTQSESKFVLIIRRGESSDDRNLYVEPWREGEPEEGYIRVRLPNGEMVDVRKHRFVSDINAAQNFLDGVVSGRMNRVLYSRKNRRGETRFVDVSSQERLNTALKINGAVDVRLEESRTQPGRIGRVTLAIGNSDSKNRSVIQRLEDLSRRSQGLHALRHQRALHAPTEGGLDHFEDEDSNPEHEPVTLDHIREIQAIVSPMIGERDDPTEKQIENVVALVRDGLGYHQKRAALEAWAKALTSSPKRENADTDFVEDEDLPDGIDEVVQRGSRKAGEVWPLVEWMVGAADAFAEENRRRKDAAAGDLDQVGQVAFEISADPEIEWAECECCGVFRALKSDAMVDEDETFRCGDDAMDVEGIPDAEELMRDIKNMEQQMVLTKDESTQQRLMETIDSAKNRMCQVMPNETNPEDEEDDTIVRERLKRIGRRGNVIANPVWTRLMRAADDELSRATRKLREAGMDMEAGDAGDIEEKAETKEAQTQDSLRRSRRAKLGLASGAEADIPSQFLGDSEDVRDKIDRVADSLAQVKMDMQFLRRQLRIAGGNVPPGDDDDDTDPDPDSDPDVVIDLAEQERLQAQLDKLKVVRDELLVDLKSLRKKAEDTNPEILLRNRFGDRPLTREAELAMRVLAAEQYKNGAQFKDIAADANAIRVAELGQEEAKINPVHKSSIHATMNPRSDRFMGAISTLGSGVIALGEGMYIHRRFVRTDKDVSRLLNVLESRWSKRKNKDTLVRAAGMALVEGMTHNRVLPYVLGGLFLRLASLKETSQTDARQTEVIRTMFPNIHADDLLLVLSAWKEHMKTTMAKKPYEQAMRDIVKQAQRYEGLTEQNQRLPVQWWLLEEGRWLVPAVPMPPVQVSPESSEVPLAFADVIPTGSSVQSLGNFIKRARVDILPPNKRRRKESKESDKPGLVALMEFLHDRQRFDLIQTPQQVRELYFGLRGNDPPLTRTEVIERASARLFR